MTNSAQFTFGYEGTEFTRHYKLTNVPDDELSGIKNRVRNLNASIAAGTAGGLSAFFRSDDFDADAGIGNFTGIVAAQYTSQTVTEIDLDGEEG